MLTRLHFSHCTLESLEELPMLPMLKEPCILQVRPPTDCYLSCNCMHPLRAILEELMGNLWIQRRCFMVVCYDISQAENTILA